jgi:nicotinamide riboside kinase
MRIGFVGAHRSGKTTLAKAVAEKLDLDTVLSGTSAIVAKHGFNMATDNRFLHPNGIAMQQEIVGALYETQVGDNFVADRTPIDAASYLLADAIAPVSTPQQQEECMIYCEHAVRETFKRFDLLVLIPPALPFEKSDDKPPPNAAYQFHHHMLCRSMLLERDEWLTTAVELPMEVLDINQRVTFVQAHIRDAALNRKLRMGLKTTRIFD